MKLLMPGVLFYDESPTKDWYVDLLEPWVHYIPVSSDLLNIRFHCEWAERNQDKVKSIAYESTKLAKSILRTEYMQAIYEEYFEHYLSEVVNAYDSRGKSWEECLNEYVKLGIHLEQVSECSNDFCETEWKPGVSVALKKI
jgi:hypothetical protein